MALSDELIREYVKVMIPKEERKRESVIYGTVVKNGNKEYVRLDGAKPEMLTPVEKTTVVDNGDRVMVTIKNHSATITGNLSNPSASNGQVTQMGSKITEFEIVIADKVSTKELTAELAKIDTLITDNFTATNAKIESLEAETAKIGTIETNIIKINESLTAAKADITTLTVDIGDFRNLTVQELDAIKGDFHTLSSDYATFKDANATNLNAINASITNLNATKLNADDADLKFATIAALDAHKGDFDQLSADYANFHTTTINRLTAADASIAQLQADKLDATSADLKYANIDFSNIQIAAIKKLFADSGIIKDITVQDGVITGELVGVTIKGDLIEANTLKADRLVIKGSDGLYYKLNLEGLGQTALDKLVTDEYAGDPTVFQEGLHGSNIIAQSITADRIKVSDLVAFGATIGGYEIRDHSIHTAAKTSALSTVKGVYMNDDGEFSIGDQFNYLRYFYDVDKDVYKLELSADVIKMGGSGRTLKQEIEQLNTKVDDNKLENVKIGARNLILESNHISLKTTDTPDAINNNNNNNKTEIIANGEFNCYSTDIKLAKDISELCQSTDKEYMFSCEVKTENIEEKDVSISFIFYHKDDPTIQDVAEAVVKKGNDGKTLKTFAKLNITDTDHDACKIVMKGVNCNGLIIDYDNFMLEEGNMPSAWAPASEDLFNELGTKASSDDLNTAREQLQESINEKATQTALDAARNQLNETIENTKQGLQDSIDEKATQEDLEAKTNELLSKLEGAQMIIDSINKTIETLVVGEDGDTMMSQTDDGFRFEFGKFRSEIINELKNQIDSEASAREDKDNVLAGQVENLEDKTAYINMGVDSNNNPVLELGKTDSNFKIQISNDTISFMNGQNRPCYIDNNIFYGNNVTVKNQLKIGWLKDDSGFYWQRRDNGNLCLSYASN